MTILNRKNLKVQGSKVLELWAQHERSLSFYWKCFKIASTENNWLLVTVEIAGLADPIFIYSYYMISEV